MKKLFLRKNLPQNIEVVIADKTCFLCDENKRIVGDAGSSFGFCEDCASQVVSLFADNPIDSDE